MKPDTAEKLLNEPIYLTVAQLAARLQVSASTIYGWVERDRIPYRLAGDLLRFDPKEIDEWMITEANRKRAKKGRPARMVS